MAQCLDVSEILGLIRGTLDEPRRSEAAAHLIKCETCSMQFQKVRDAQAGEKAVHQARTQIEATSAMEVPASSGGGSHWTDNNLPVDAIGQAPRSATNVSLDEFLSGLSKSGLLPPSELANVKQKSTADPATSTVAGMIEWLVQEHKLTRYQAETLAGGGSGGLLLGNYIILEKVGQGGMGTVFKARHRRMNRVVALKVLPLSLSSVPEAIIRFQREVEAAARLQHTNIAAAFDADEASGVHFLVMEYVDGPNLASYVKHRGALPLATAVRLTIHAARALATAHAAGVVHRDIKPSNIMVNRQGVLKVLDMGLAQMRDADVNIDLTSDVTQTGRVMGTIDYMAPEQARDAKNVDLRADIYSLGCTLYFLATGKPPAPAGSATEKLLWHQNKTSPPLSSVAPESTPLLDGVLAKMMAKSVEERYASMHSVADDLERCLADLPPGEPGTLVDGLELLTEHVSPTISGSNYSQATLIGSAGDTVISPPTHQPATGRKRSDARPIVYACGIGGTLALVVTLAVLFHRGWGASGTPAGGKADKQTPVATATKGAENLPQPVAAPSPHAAYEKLLVWVFQNHGRVTAVSGDGEQLQLTEIAKVPHQPVEILGVKLDGTGVQDDDMQTLALAPGLRDLSLADTKITDQGLEPLARLKQLTHLNLSKTNVTNAGLTQLSRLAELSELNLERTRVTDAGMTRLVALLKLERLDLSDTQVTDVGLDQLKNARSLKLLTVHGTSLSDRQHKALKSGLPQLEIAWDGADVERGVALALLEKGARLAVLDRAGRRQENIKNVESLPPGRVSIRDVNLTTGSSFVDNDLKQVALLPDIESIALSGTKISHTGLGHLHGSATLRKIDLGTLRLSPAAVEGLRKSLPNCEVLVREPADVEVSRAVLAAGGRVTLVTERNQTVPDIRDAAALPAGQYTLRGINLDDRSQIDDAALEKLSELPGLESLFLTNTSITDKSLASIAACKGLQELSLSGTRVTSAGIANLTPLPKLSRLYLAKTSIGPEGLRHVGELAALTHLSLLSVMLTDDDVAPLKRLEQLEWLDLSGTSLTDNSLVHLTKLRKLRELNVTATALSDAAREELAKDLGNACHIVGNPPDQQRLAARWLLDHAATVSLDSGPVNRKSLPRGACRVVSVDLGQLSQLKREEIKAQLASCVDVVSLNLSDTKLLEPDLAFLSSMRKLRELKLANVPVTDRIFELLASAANLETLDLTGARITGQGLKHLAASSLTQLILPNTAVSDLHFAALAQFPRLEVLDVSSTANITDVGVESLCKIPSLRVVGLRRSRITDAAFDHLAKLPSLEQLDVEGTKVSDGAIAKLASSAKLRQIGLANTQVTDGVTATLAQMKQLRSINLARTRISAESVKQLQNELKGCSVIAPTQMPRDPNAPGATTNFGPGSTAIPSGRSP